MYTHAGLGAVDFVDPPSGSVIGNFEGTVNATTLTCNVSSSGGTRLPTDWNIVNFRGSTEFQQITDTFDTDLFSISGGPLPSNPGISTFNQLKILNVTSELDGVLVYCGTGAQPQQANFTLRLYRK